MATKRKVSRPKGKPVSERIRRAAERSGIKRARPRPAVAVRREELDRWDALLEQAQRLAVQAAPRPFPTKGDGMEAALAAYDKIRWVRRAVGEALGGSS